MEDASLVGPLFDRIVHLIGTVLADSAYDSYAEQHGWKHVMSNATPHPADQRAWSVRLARGSQYGRHFLGERAMMHKSNGLCAP